MRIQLNKSNSVRLSNLRLNVKIIHKCLRDVIKHTANPRRFAPVSLLRATVKSRLKVNFDAKILAHFGYMQYRIRQADTERAKQIFIVDHGIY